MNHFATDWFDLPYKGISDKRLETVRHVESDFPLRDFNTLKQWEKFKKEAQKKMLISIGLWPYPDSCPMEPRRFDRQEFNGYYTEKVIFQSRPGLYVTGCLYWPKQSSGKVPMILNPHGHWDQGRFEMSEITRIPQRCVNFALHGMASFSFDMIGFGDSRQLPHEGYASYELDLWNESLLGLQIYHCLRALDFVWDLPEVDRSRIGSTGASGGGTQTFWLTALDERVSVSMPVNMISTTFQGACICEYSPNLHIGLSNIEMAAMMAPRPMMLAGSTGDWTYELPIITYPWLQKIYELYGAKDNISYFYREGPHGYEQSAQEAAYQWFYRQFFGEELSEKETREKPCEQGTLEAVRIFGTDFDLTLPNITYQELFQGQKARKKKKIQELMQTQEGQAELKEALAFAIGDTNVSFTRKDVKAQIDSHITMKKELLESSQGAEIPLVILSQSDNASDKILYFASTEGKRRLIDNLNQKGLLDQIFRAGFSIACADLFMTGEYIRPYGSNGRNFSLPTYSWCENQYVTTYNYTDTAYRVQDYIGIYHYLKGYYEDIIPVSLDRASAWVAAALPFLTDVTRAYGDLSYYDGADDIEYVDNFFLPGFLNSGGFEACEKLSGVTLKPLSEVLGQIAE